MIRRLRLFVGGAVQVAAITGQTWMISRGEMAGVFLVGCLISWIWTLNVRAVAIGSWQDRACYALGAGCGAVCGLLLAQRMT